MNVWLFALRNAGRNRRRSLLAGGIISFGFAALALSGGFMAQTFDALRDGTIRGGVGHLQFTNPDAADDAAGLEALRHGLADASRAVTALRGDSQVVEVLERTEFFGLLTDGEVAIPFAGVGVDPEAERRTMDAPRLVTSGRWLEEGDGRDAHEVVLGSGLAGALGVSPGEVVTMMAMSVDGVLNAIDAEVVGIATLPVREMDDRYLATSLGAADTVLLAHGAVSKLVVLIADPSRVEAEALRLHDRLEREGIQTAVRTWPVLAVFYRQVRQLYLGMFGFLGLVLLLIVLLATANTMLMVTTERTREIGTLRALGARRGRIQRYFLAEGVTIGGLGCMAGAILALVLREILNRAEILLPPPPGVAHPVPLFIRFYPTAYALGAAIMILAVVLATWIPARRASRRPIIDSLAHV